MNSAVLRVALGSLFALALLEGACGRPHSHATHHEQSSGAELGNQLRTRHHRDGHHLRSHHSQRHVTALQDEQKLEQRVRLCGTQLSNALQNICNGRGYNEPDSSPGTGSRSGRTRVVRECCHEGCSYSDLELYCQPRKTPAPSPAHDSTATPDLLGTSESSRNQIRPATASMESSEEEDNAQKADSESEPRLPDKPSVVGGTTGNEVNLSARFLDLAQPRLVDVGILPARHGVPIPIRTRHASNALKSH